MFCDGLVSELGPSRAAGIVFFLKFTGAEVRPDYPVFIYLVVSGQRDAGTSGYIAAVDYLKIRFSSMKRLRTGTFLV